MAYKDTGNVRIDFLDMITSDNSHVCAWTWSKLTANEKRIFEKILYDTVKNYNIEDEAEYSEEWRKIQDLYHDLLDLVGYKPLGWREEKEVKEITVKLSVDADGNVEIIK